MTVRLNDFGQPIGPEVPGWSLRPRPPMTPMVGRYCQVVPLDPDRHGPALYEEFAAAPDQRAWTYLAGSEPPVDAEAYLRALCGDAADTSRLDHAVCDPAGHPLGVASYLRIDQANGSIEVGSIHFGPRLARTVAATEAMVLMMRRAFDELGYRRYEWKCDSLNAPSRAAAERLGFTFEGIFRQAMVYQGRNRDTAWYSIIDTEWPPLRASFQQWLADSNVDPSGRQRVSLGDIRRRGTTA